MISSTSLDYKLNYKPGKSNVAGNALLRNPHNKSVDINAITATVHSEDSSGENLTPNECPNNMFKNFIFILIGEVNEYQSKLHFPTMSIHIITASCFSENELVRIFKKYLNPTFEEIM